MRRIVRGAAIVTALMALASSAEAQGISPISFGVAGGMSFPMGEDRDYVDNGYHGDVMVGFHLPTAPISFRLDGFYHKFNGKDAFDGGTSRVIGGTGNVVWDVPAGAMVKMYVTGGVGMYNMKLEADVPVLTDLRLGVVTETVEEKMTMFGLNGGMGVRFSLAGITPFVEARYHSVFTEGEKTNMVPVSLGIMFR
jgi:opacity protein-like surface antigen